MQIKNTVRACISHTFHIHFTFMAAFSLTIYQTVFYNLQNERCGCGAVLHCVPIKATLICMALQSTYHTIHKTQSEKNIFQKLDLYFFLILIIM